MEETKKETSDLGKLIDMDFNTFKVELHTQKVNVGTMNNMNLSLMGAYEELNRRREDIVKGICNDTVDHDKGTELLKGIYAELIKIEQKSQYLTEKVKEIMQETEQQIDSTSN